MSVGPFGPWQAVERIGMGAFGVTWRCKHEQDGREAAVKVLLAEHLDHPSYIERFQAEVELLRNLTRSPHAHLASFDGADESPGGPRWLALTYVPGMDLSSCLRDELLPDGTRLGTTRDARRKLALTVGRAIASATSHAHAKGIAHRDIKPSNIRLTPNGGVVLLDFGIGRDARLTRLTAQGQSSPHTVTYAAPEILQNKVIDDAWLSRVDVYSLGVMLYELLTGRAPDVAVISSEDGLKVTARADALVPPNLFTPQLVRIVSEMTAPDPTRRPDMASVHAQLLRIPHIDAKPDVVTPAPIRALAPPRVSLPTMTLPGDDEQVRKTVPEEQDWSHLVTPPVGLPEPARSTPAEADPAPAPRQRHSEPGAMAFPPLVIALLMALGIFGGWVWTKTQRPELPTVAGQRDVVNAFDQARLSQLCGNGTVDAGEECDDGNTTPEDGCTECATDPQPADTPAPAVRKPTPKPRPKPTPVPFPPADDAQLQSYVRSARRSSFSKLIAHIDSHPGWLEGFGAAAVRSVVDASVRSHGGKRPAKAQGAVAPLLGSAKAANCGQAIQWLSWAYGTRPDRSNAFYGTWCSRCTEQFPPIDVGKHACGAVQDYAWVGGQCVNPSMAYFGSGC